VETSSGLKLGYASLDMSLYSHLTAHEHVDLLGKLRACPVDADKVLGSVGLSVSRDKLVGQFSTGMRARLKLALATVHQPDLLMLDEPTAALDEAGQDIVESVVRGQLSRGAVVLATNDKKDRRHATHELELAG
jgi:ABC-type multidrug transport system ATPase subunit